MPRRGKVRGISRKKVNEPDPGEDRIRREQACEAEKGLEGWVLGNNVLSPLGLQHS